VVVKEANGMVVMNVHARYSIYQIDKQSYMTNLSMRQTVITNVFVV